MAVFKVEGGHRLHGSITPQGAKNEALQILCATLLTPERVTVHNIPQILDVMQLIELLRAMGVEVDRLSDDTYSFRAREIDFDYLRTDDYRRRCARLRGSVMLIGPMLARFGVGYIPKPGGDKIGRRRLDTHFLGFQKLGAKFNFDVADDFFMVEGRELKGTYMLLDEASVTGTANIIMAAVLARGTTTIYNAACEPYVQQLCRMLNRMGARISGIASNLLTIEGVESLGGTDHTLLPDLIEVGVDMLNLGQPALNAPDCKSGIEHMGKLYAGKVCFCTPADYQTTSIQGTPAENREEVRRIIESMDTPDGGLIAYILDYTENMGMPKENYRAIIDAFVEYGKKS